MRNRFITKLIDLAHHNDKLILVVGDLGYNVVEPFADLFPERFLNAGVSEQNMMGLAAGLASEGMHVFVYSIANFPLFRCAEQIRNDVDYHNLPVTIVSVGGGLAYGALGYSHHALQDYALIRTLPNMLIASPGDPQEVEGCLDFLNENPQPSYLRLGKAGEKEYHSKIPKPKPGLWQTVKESPIGSSAPTLITTGAVLQSVMEWSKHPKLKDFQIKSLPIWGLASKKNQIEQVMSTEGIVITVEDHLFDAGFGSWMKESLGGNAEAESRLRHIALTSEVFGLVGSQEALNEKGGISLESVLKILS